MSNASAQAPTGALPEGGLRVERCLPDVALRRHVAAYFSVQLNVGDGPAAVRTVPDGCSDLMFDLGAHPRAWLRGPRTCASRYEHQAPSSLLGVQLLPGAAHVLTGMPADALVDATQELAQTMAAVHADGAAAAQRLLQALCSACTLSERAAVLDGYLAAHLAARAVDRRVTRAFDELKASAGSVEIATLAAHCATSERNLTRLFKRWVGLGPKRLAMILRFQCVLESLVRGEPPEWAALAHDLGYSDQPHLIRDFAAFAGLAPASLQRAAAPRQAGER